MEEKYMVNDILKNLKNDLKTYQYLITETTNTDLRQVLQQIRNSKEAFEYDLFRLSSLKGYTTSIPNVTTLDLSNAKKELEE